ncbi:MAG: type II secretion system F family protein [Gemmataceae bacterium]
MNPEQLAEFNEQIAGMARAGLPLDQGLASLARDMGRGKLRHVTKALAEDLRNGLSLPEALEKRRESLPPFYAALATAGVRTGRLPEVLQTLTSYAQTIASTRSLVIEAFIYPSVVIVVATCVVVMMWTIVLPNFDAIFKDFKMALPATTEIVLLLGSISKIVVLAVFAIPLVAIVSIRFAMRRTLEGQKSWAKFVYSIPVFGVLLKSARLAAFTDLLGLMIEYAVPLPEAFQLAGDASSDPYITFHARRIREQLEHGQPLGQVLRTHELLPEWVAWMATAGERRGELASTLRQTATVYRRMADSRARVLRNVLPAFLIIGTAVIVVGVFVGTLVAPMLKLLEGLSK